MANIVRGIKRAAQGIFGAVGGLFGGGDAGPGATFQRLQAAQSRVASLISAREQQVAGGTLGGGQRGLLSFGGTGTAGLAGLLRNKLGG